MLIDGKKIAQEIEKRLARQIRALNVRPTPPLLRQGSAGLRGAKPPHLAVVLVGDDPASKIYVGKKKEAAERVGIKVTILEKHADITDGELIKQINALNHDPKINGIIVQLPLPKGLDEEKILGVIDPSKDVDGVTPGSRFIPATAGAVLEVLERQKAKVKGANAVVVGRGRVAGLPIALSLLKQDATVTICHSKTKDLSFHTKQADILVSAVGRPWIIKPGMVKRGAAVIDVGISRRGGKILGDVDPKVEKIACFLTPVPGGIGPLTVAKLLENTLLAYQHQNP